MALGSAASASCAGGDARDHRDHPNPVVPGGTGEGPCVSESTDVSLRLI